VIKVLFLMLILAPDAPVQPLPEVSAEAVPRQTKSVGKEDAILEELLTKGSQSEGSAGVATYYAKKFIGRKTTTGVRYDPEKMTAAHATLPFGTVVRVVNPKTGEDVVVTINDRCHPRHAKKNLIDLSSAAAKKISLWGKGMIKVEIIPLEFKGNTPKMAAAEDK
jgi:rare lipoprotein A